MFVYGLPAPVGIGPRFQAIILGLCVALGYPVDRARAPIPLMDQTFRLLRRRLNRFMALVARFHAGTLPVVRPHRSAASARTAPEPTPPLEPVPAHRAPVPVPRDHGWLVRLVGFRAAAYTEHLELLMAEPEMAEFLAAAPQAGRLLRPLWRMLNRYELPDVLRAPPRCAPPARAAKAPVTGSAHAPAPTRAVRVSPPGRGGQEPFAPDPGPACSNGREPV